ncbi:MAG: hypothetical protein RLZZ171_1501 [Cyanobacteriota bacterium]|jgi:hypothetical protein
MLTLITKIKELPDFWLLCITLLLLPLCIGAGVKIASTEAISYSNGNTQIALGKTVAQSDRLISEQNEQINLLTESVQVAQQAAKKRKINLPELKQVEAIAQETEQLSEDLEANNEDLQDFIK